MRSLRSVFGQSQSEYAHSTTPASSLASLSSMPSTEKQKDLSRRHRSFKGCWTCKKKRIQCDEARPACQKCSSRGLACEGYEIRLRWGAGIASRGKYSGAEKPVKEYIPSRSKRRLDIRDEGDRCFPGDEDRQPAVVSQPLTKEDQNQLVAERATVNIPNSWEPNSPRNSAIKKHFEIPKSLATLSVTAVAVNGRDEDISSQYAQNAGRRSILA
ncbi:transcriptional regulator family: Fungal Specific TF [Penicillium roqueforti]|nr:transcriptional regulator family: Fungal Specific TF [Penicillium roqueforti]KAF9251499.1 transcriptional regulator family: Fungal Specific TF [Penicillium roqueforti]KAI1836688.1 transcriptional regulator family: Fungal Specific TF [Penicillium roqueforti]KAI2685174.1 transcriptional regulator family: Fungal Specific TF [Penicillium roqueforti]KAI2690492.1 transcriptional regulator family: Fungal Specific TF [Penicillium roqueforti]KAI2696013.1 transcriptional regulator family: Fungal Spec